MPGLALSSCHMSSERIRLTYKPPEQRNSHICYFNPNTIRFGQKMCTLRIFCVLYFILWYKQSIFNCAAILLILYVFPAKNEFSGWLSGATGCMLLFEPQDVDPSRPWNVGFYMYLYIFRHVRLCHEKSLLASSLLSIRMFQRGCRGADFPVESGDFMGICR